MVSGTGECLSDRDSHKSNLVGMRDMKVHWVLWTWDTRQSEEGLRKAGLKGYLEEHKIHTICCSLLFYVLLLTLIRPNCFLQLRSSKSELILFENFCTIIHVDEYEHLSGAKSSHYILKEFRHHTLTRTHKVKNHSSNSSTSLLHPHHLCPGSGPYHGYLGLLHTTFNWSLCLQPFLLPIWFPQSPQSHLSQFLL